MSELQVLKQKLRDTQTECDRLHQEKVALTQLVMTLQNEIFALRKPEEPSR